jgi:hypothetical protein
LTAAGCILEPEEVNAMASSGSTAAGLSGAVRMTWVQDQLAHVLEHAETDEPSGTWTGLACPDHGLALGTDVDTATLQHLSAHGQLADLIWEAPEKLTADHGQWFRAAIQAGQAANPELAERLWQEVRAIWSQAWAANYAMLELLQNAGLTRFAAVKPQRWVVASFEHHCGPHGLPRPHVHNIVLTDLTAGAPAPGKGSRSSPPVR